MWEEEIPFFDAGFHACLLCGRQSDTMLKTLFRADDPLFFDFELLRIGLRKVFVMGAIVDNLFVHFVNNN